MRFTAAVHSLKSKIDEAKCFRSLFGQNIKKCQECITSQLRNKSNLIDIFDGGN